MRAYGVQEIEVKEIEGKNAQSAFMRNRRIIADPIQTKRQKGDKARRKYLTVQRPNIFMGWKE